MPEAIATGNGPAFRTAYNAWVATLNNPHPLIYSGTLAQRPAANAAFAGALYRATDVANGRAIFVCNGTVWKLFKGKLLLGAGAVQVNKTSIGQVALASASCPIGLLTANSRILINFIGRITAASTDGNRFWRTRLNTTEINSIIHGGTAPPAITDWQSEITFSSLLVHSSSRNVVLSGGAVNIQAFSRSFDASGAISVQVTAELNTPTQTDTMTLESWEMWLLDF